MPYCILELQLKYVCASYVSQIWAMLALRSPEEEPSEIEEMDTSDPNWCWFYLAECGVWHMFEVRSLFPLIMQKMKLYNKNSLVQMQIMCMWQTSRIAVCRKYTPCTDALTNHSQDNRMICIHSWSPCLSLTHQVYILVRHLYMAILDDSTRQAHI